MCFVVCAKQSIQRAAVLCRVSPKHYECYATIKKHILSTHRREQQNVSERSEADKTEQMHEGLKRFSGSRETWKLSRSGSGCLAREGG